LEDLLLTIVDEVIDGLAEDIESVYCPLFWSSDSKRKSAACDISFWVARSKDVRIICLSWNPSAKMALRASGTRT
jgi:hypothetical protein